MNIDCEIHKKDTEQVKELKKKIRDLETGIRRYRAKLDNTQHIDHNYTMIYDTEKDDNEGTIEDMNRFLDICRLWHQKNPDLIGVRIYIDQRCIQYDRE